MRNFLFFVARFCFQLEYFYSCLFYSVIFSVRRRYLCMLLSNPPPASSHLYTEIPGVLRNFINSYSVLESGCGWLENCGILRS